MQKKSQLGGTHEVKRKKGRIEVDGTTEHTCGAMASTISRTASNSLESRRITHRAEMASHIAGRSRARWAEEAARSTMLKPFSGIPDSAKTRALSVRRVMRWRMSFRLACQQMLL